RINGGHHEPAHPTLDRDRRCRDPLWPRRIELRFARMILFWALWAKRSVPWTKSCSKHLQPTSREDGCFTRLLEDSKGGGAWNVEALPAATGLLSFAHPPTRVT